jgi:glutamyl-Q tRNA(Asp) synthetase
MIRRMVTIGRFAPSPTGPLHFGSLVAALGSWLCARAGGGLWRVRIEDLDPPREPAGSDRLILSQLATLGLAADGEVLYQGTRHQAYADALARLVAADAAYPCACSRGDLEPFAGIHPETCVRGGASGLPAAWRLRVPVDTVIGFDDALQGTQRQDVGAAVGDFVLRRADGLWSYQLAVVVDDAWQGVTEVVRGADLLDSTPRQILLQRALGLPTPRYLHLPLATDGAGRKLAKSAGDRPLDADPLASLRAALAFLGQAEAARATAATPTMLLAAACECFRRESLPRAAVRVAPRDFV